MSNHSERPPIIKVQTKYFTLTGQNARALLALVKAGKKGCTALEVSSWAWRFGAYVFILRHDHNLDIETIREDHPGGWHARYVLHTPVELIETEA